MAHQWRQIRLHDDDLADPWDWIKSHKDFVEEFNGRFDRDNLPEDAIDEDLIKGGAFNEVRQNADTVDATLSGVTAGWTSTDSSGNVFSQVLFTSREPAMLIVQWSATWGFTATTAYQTGDQDDQHIEFRITVDGREIALHGASSLARNEWCGGIVGATAIDGGQHLVQVQFRTANAADRLETIDVTLKERVLLCRWRKA